jgi:hypothetical protein
LGEPLERWDSIGADDPPVTAVASRRVKPGSEVEFEEWVAGVTGAGARFPGYLGSNTFRPSSPDDEEYQMSSSSITPVTSSAGKAPKSVAAGTSRHVT